MLRPKSESKMAATAQVFSPVVEMRFKPSSQQASECLAKRRQKIKKGNKQLVEIYDPSTMAVQAERKIESQQARRLKFVVSLSQEHFLVGNQNQLDMIGFGAIAQSYVETDFFWSLSLKGPIESVTVEPKRSLFLLLCQSTLQVYRYSVKSKEQPELVSTLALKEGVRFIRFLKDFLLAVFYSTSYEIYNVQNLNLVKKKLEKGYPVDGTKQLLTVPPAIENIINIFFQQPKEDQQSFILWCLEINFGNEQIKTRELYHVYDVVNYAKGKLTIQNCTKDIIFMNLNHQIIVIKNGYLIDTLNVSVRGEDEFLKCIRPETLLHITKKHLEVYNISINMAVKPEKIVLRSVDSIELQKYPENAFFIAVLQSFNNFAIFFEDSDKKSRQTKGEISYYFEVSQTTSVKMKIKSIFDSLGFGEINPQLIEEKYNMALKMGLSEKEIYLQIWNRSSRCSHLDYKYILATRDYRTIKSEIEKKLKKESMNLREILKIQESCHEINKQKVESAACTQQDLQDFVSSHFLLQKLKLFKEVLANSRSPALLDSEQGDSGESRQLKIDVQQYYFYKNLDIKAFLLGELNRLYTQLGDNARTVRMTLKTFKFIYRLIYPQFLQQLIISLQDYLITLLDEFPEVLPYVSTDLNEKESKEGLYGGIWGEIESNEWEDSLYPENVENLHNKGVLGEFVESVWFKRHWLTSHGMTCKSRKEILKTKDFNNSDKIFYFFIAKLFEHSRCNTFFCEQVVSQLQEKYVLFPAHLKNKIVLYENLYKYYCFEEKESGIRLPLSEFLEWDDQKLFKYFFDHQKIKKNSLLKEIKPIFEQSVARGSHIFNIGLFSYFYSDLSDISDLKFILNRINNEKAEFHRQNQGIYEVLVRSMQLKLRIGSPNDIPIDEVMVYIENIPAQQEREIQQQLSVMQAIKSEAKLFQRMKIDMTVKDIMEKFELVIEKMLNYLIGCAGVLEMERWEQFREASLRILQETEDVKSKIYMGHHQANQNASYALLVYFSVVMKSERAIAQVARLLQDPQLHRLFPLDLTTIENIVLYMFKWKFSESAKFTDNAEYLRRLLDLLPAGNQCRGYLLTQVELGLALSSERSPFLYPLSLTSYSPSARTIQEAFKAQQAAYLLALDLKKLHQLLQKMEAIVHSQAKEGGEVISLHKLYEIVIVELLQKGLYGQVIDYLYKIIKIQSPIKNASIIYLALYIYKLAKEFNEESKKCIFKLLAFYFKEPQPLLKILEFIVTTRLTGLQKTKYLKAIYQNESQPRLNFNFHNSMLSKGFTSQHHHANAKQVIEVYRDDLKSKNQEFQHGSEYDIIFTFLCHSPYLLIKFLQLERDHLRFKEIGMFIRMAVSRPIFSQRKSYEVLKRIFASLVISSQERGERGDIDFLLVGFQSKSTDDEFQVPKFSKLNEQQTKIFKIVRSFTKAEQKLKKKQSISREDLKEKKLLQIRAVIDNPNTILQDKFDFEDSDSEILPSDGKQLVKAARPLQIAFDSTSEKTQLFFRKVQFNQFIQHYFSGQTVKGGELQLIKKQSAPALVNNKLSDKVKSYKAKRNQMIKRLRSHRIAIGQEYQDEPQACQQDLQFLAKILPNKKDMNESRSLAGSISSRAKAISEEISNINTNINNESAERGNVPLDQELLIDPKANEEPTPQTNSFGLLREQLMRTFNQTKIPRFEIEPIQHQINLRLHNELGNTMQVQTFLRDFFSFLFAQSPQLLSVNLKLIEDIARKYPVAGVNNFFIQAYQRTLTTHEKHGLQMKIAQVLPFSGIYIKSKDIIDLYREIEPLIVSRITDQNVFKLSKLIALGFRKSIVEQEILFKYMRGLMQSYLNCGEEDAPALAEKLNSILQKLQTQVIIDKGEELFGELGKGERRDQLLLSYTDVLKKKGYASAARELISKLV